MFPQTLPPLPLPPVFLPYAPVSEPIVPCVLQSSRTMPSQTPKPGSLATANEPKMQAASTGESPLYVFYFHVLRQHGKYPVNGYVAPPVALSANEQLHLIQFPSFRKYFVCTDIIRLGPTCF